MAWGADRSGERGREGVELGLEAGVVGARAAALHEVPDRVTSQFPGLLDFWGLGGLDGSGSEVVFAGGDLDPDVDGGDLAFPVAELGPLRTGDGREPRDQGLPGVFVDRPGLQGPAASLKVNQRGCGLIEFGGEGLECRFEGERIRLLPGGMLRRDLCRSRSGFCVARWCLWLRSRGTRRPRRASRRQPSAPAGAPRCGG